MTRITPTDDIVEAPLLPCHDKLAFTTREKAQAAATVDAHLHGSKLKVYKCHHCPMWHLSSH